LSKTDPTKNGGRTHLLWKGMYAVTFPKIINKQEVGIQPCLA